MEGSQQARVLVRELAQKYGVSITKLTVKDRRTILKRAITWVKAVRDNQSGVAQQQPKAALSVIMRQAARDQAFNHA